MTAKPYTEQRVIRVFVSSTFRDMKEEREILVKRVFPQLRKMCEERGVTWGEVDLRWGVTDEQKAEGKVLPICLEEIKRCRPYFIGLLGERYGWITDAIPEDLIDREPWLKEHLSHSVTELEILHGVLNNPDKAEHAFFYFRDSRYVERIPPERRQDFTAEGAEAANKLQKLKQRIRLARDEQFCELREGYGLPEQLGEWILKDFTVLIEKLYPEKQILDPLDQEATRHEAYAQSRRLAFVGREDLLKQLDDYISAAGEPVVLTGDSGCGKSALLAEWVARWRRDHPDDLIIQHYIGSTPESADWRGLVRRILAELKRAFGISGDVPFESDALRRALHEWTAKGPSSRRVVLVLDALNQLVKDSAVPQLEWLPALFPSNFGVFVSSLPGESLDVMLKRGWPRLSIPLFAQADIALAALAFFKIFGKTPPPDIMAKLESTPAARNPLYLRVVLDELRQFGAHQELQAKAADYLSAPDLPALFDRILTRWHNDFGKDPEYPDIVGSSLCLIACSRFGLSESELLDLLGPDGERLPRGPWTPFYLAAEGALVLRSGLLNFGHEYLRAAVKKRWLDNKEIVRGFRIQLSNYFRRVGRPADRKMDELPWVLREIEQWDLLRDYLIDVPTFLRFCSDHRRKEELHDHWRAMQAFHDPAASYEAAAKNCESSDSFLAALVTDLIGEIAEFHFERAEYAAAEALYRRALSLEDAHQVPNPVAFIRHLTGLSLVLQRKGQFSEAEDLLRRALRVTRRTYGEESASTAACVNNLAQVLLKSDRLEEAEKLLREALSLAERISGSDSPDIVAPLSNLGRLLQLKSRLIEAEALYRRAATIQEQSYGSFHPDLASCLNGLAHVLHQLNRSTEAEALFRRVLNIDEVYFGNTRPNRADTLRGLSSVYQSTGRIAEAERLLREALYIDECALGSDDANVATDLNELAGLLRATGRLAEMEPLMRRALAIDERIYGVNHSTVARDLNNLAMALHGLNRSSEAEPLARRAVAIGETTYGADHPNVVKDVSNLAIILMSMNRLSEAEPLMRRMVMTFVRSAVANNRPDPQLQFLIGNYMAILEQMGETRASALQRLNALGRPFGIRFGDPEH